MPSFASGRRRLVLAIGALLALMLIGGLWLRTSSFVRVNAVTVTGVQGSQAKEIRDALSVAARDMTTLHVDEDALRRAVSTYPVVRDVHATAGFPHRLRIAVDAYDPVVALRVGGSQTAVAADGTLLRGSPTSALAVLGVKTMPGGERVGDAGAQRAIRLLAAAPAPLRGRVAVVFRSKRGLAATVRNGPKLYFGSCERLRAKWSAAAQVLADTSAQGASYVDVRIPERPVAGGFQPRPLPGTLPSTLG
ncbi:MAG: cell division protein FtsQ [Solirubrobacteraceae bacterium]|nr:cell division protein FtsQ [Solirubrobacteraceae bacterium]